MWENILILPLSAALLFNPSVSPETRSFESVAEIRAELERLKTEYAPPAVVQAQVEAYEEWRRSPWRGGRIGVDPVPVQEVDLVKSTEPAV